MSFYQYTTEEIKIHNVNKQTTFVASLLKNYIQSFAGSKSSETFELIKATLTIDGETSSTEEIFCDEGKMCRLASKGKNKGKLVPIGSKPSQFYGMMNHANYLESAKEISFFISYEWKAHAFSDTNIYYWSRFFEAFNCSELRNNVQYRGIETYDYDHSMFVYRFDKDYQGEAEFNDDPSVVSGVNEWDLDGNSDIFCNYENDVNPFESPDKIKSVVSRIKPILDKYGLEIEEYKEGLDSISIYNWLTVSSPALNEFFEDFQKLLDILQSFGLTIGGYTNHLEHIEPGTIALIRFRIDENNRVQKEYLCI